MLDKLLDILDHPTSAALGAAIGAGIASFFNVPVFYAILILVAFDFITGLYKAKLQRRVRSSKFSAAGERIVLYTMMYIPLHAFSMVGGSMMELIDDAVLGIFLTREILSILENIKTISVIRGKPFPFIDMIIDYVGMDLPALLEDTLPGYGMGAEQPQEQQPAATNQQALPLNPAQTPPNTP